MAIPLFVFNQFLVHLKQLSDNLSNVQESLLPSAYKPADGIGIAQATPARGGRVPSS